MLNDLDPNFFKLQDSTGWTKSFCQPALVMMCVNVYACPVSFFRIFCCCIFSLCFSRRHQLKWIRLVVSKLSNLALKAACIQKCIVPRLTRVILTSCGSVICNVAYNINLLSYWRYCIPIMQSRNVLYINLILLFCPPPVVVHNEILQQIASGAAEVDVHHSNHR